MNVPLISAINVCLSGGLAGGVKATQSSTLTKVVFGLNLPGAPVCRSLNTDWYCSDTRSEQELHRSPFPKKMSQDEDIG